MCGKGGVIIFTEWFSRAFIKYVTKVPTIPSPCQPCGGGVWNQILYVDQELYVKPAVKAELTKTTAMNLWFGFDNVFLCQMATLCMRLNAINGLLVFFYYTWIFIYIRKMLRGKISSMMLQYVWIKNRITSMRMNCMRLWVNNNILTQMTCLFYFNRHTNRMYNILSPLLENDYI